MSEEEQPRWRRWFGSTGAPPQFGLVGYLLGGGMAAGALGLILNPQKGALLAALTGALIAAAGSRGPSRIALRIAGLVAVLAVLLLASGIRFHLLGEQSLWSDEGNSYVQATRSFKAIADHASRDIHPPGYRVEAFP